MTVHPSTIDLVRPRASHHLILGGDPVDPKSKSLIHQAAARREERAMESGDSKTVVEVEVRGAANR